MNIKKQKTIMKLFVTSQLSYWSLILIVGSRRLKKKLDSLHEKALRITYQDNTSTFQELLDKNNSLSIHHINLQVLATEIFKKGQAHSVYHGTKSLLKIWDLIPVELKQSESLEYFKLKIKNWVPFECLCRL